MVQKLCKAVAIIKQSKKLNLYFSLTNNAFKITLLSILQTLVILNKLLTICWQISSFIFNFLRQALYVSIITSELMLGVFCNKVNAMDCLLVLLLSQAYTQMLLSKKMLLIQIFSAPFFYVVGINSILFKKINSFFVGIFCNIFNGIKHQNIFYFNSRYFNAFPQHIIWQLQGASIGSRYHNLAYHTIFFRQK